jgi:hypothetical protein
MQWDPVCRLCWPLGGHFPVTAGKVQDIAIDEVSGALSMHVAPPVHMDWCGTRRSDNPVRAS